MYGIIQSIIIFFNKISVSQDKYLNTEEFINKVVEFLTKNLDDYFNKKLPKY